MDARALVRSMAVVTMALGLVVVAGPVAGEQINLQARLTDAQGQPITVQTAVRLSIYRGGTANQAGSGTLVYDESPVNVTPDAAGVFNYLLGTTPATGTLDGATFASSEPFFLEVKIGTTPLLPRQSIVFGARALSAAGLSVHDDQNRSTAAITDGGTILRFFEPVSGGIASLNGLNSAGFGITAIFGGASRARVATLNTFNNGDGSIQVQSVDGTKLINLDGSTGNVTASGTKNFRIPHPDDPDRRSLTYASMEGPEVGIYLRSSAVLVNGAAAIDLPRHFTVVASPAGMTVQLTPRSAESEGLAVAELTPERLRVKELRHGTGSYEFDYFVQAVRRGYQGFDPESDQPAGRPTATAPTSTSEAR